MALPKSPRPPDQGCVGQDGEYSGSPVPPRVSIGRYAIRSRMTVLERQVQHDGGVPVPP